MQPLPLTTRSMPGTVPVISESTEQRDSTPDTRRAAGLIHLIISRLCQSIIYKLLRANRAGARPPSARSTGAEPSAHGPASPSTQCSTSSKLRSVIRMRLEFSISSLRWAGHMYCGAGLTKKIRVSPVETWLSQINGSPKPPITTLFPPSNRIS